MKNRLIAIALALLLLGLLALLLTGAAQAAIVIPLLYAAWLARVLFESIPQALLWLALLTVAGYTALHALPWPRSRVLDPLQGAEPRAAVAGWSDLIRRAQRSDYGRWALAQRLGYLAKEVIEQDDRDPARPLWVRLSDGSLDFPDDVQAFLRAGTAATPTSARPARRWAWRLGQWPPWERVPDPLALDPEIVVRLIEERMERE
ncbi:MAG: hypothetical protein IPO81_26790 [Kouleothrix sp.]|nr:hypothetical protein [Kouleothrix sp.]